MRRKEHIMVDEIVFKTHDFEYVHEWLDATFGEWVDTEHSPYRHWIKRHNVTALEEKFEAEIERNVGYLHILCDWLSHFGMYYLPEDEEKVEWMLKYKDAYW